MRSSPGRRRASGWRPPAAAGRRGHGRRRRRHGPARRAQGTKGFTFVATDVTDEAAVAASSPRRSPGRLSTASSPRPGVAGGGLAHQVEADEWARVIAVNLTGTFLVAKHAIARMLDAATASTASAARS